MATAGTVLLATTPAHAEFELEPAPADERVPCEQVNGGGDPLNTRPWSKNFIGLDDAQQYNRGTFERGEKAGEPVTIAVIDSGVSSTRDDVFGDRLLSGYDWWDVNAKGMCDSNSHGTAVASIAAGGVVGNNDFVGVAPEADILPIRVFSGADDEGGDEQKSRITAGAIIDAVNNGADVINLSLVVVPTDELEAAVNTALDAGVVVVGATGNEAKNMDDDSIEYDQQTFYPANYPGVIAVAAHNQSGNWYASSNFGNRVDLLAPGQGLAFPYAGGEWKDGEGTSYAAPFVTGAAALLKGEFGSEATPAWIQKRLQETAIHPPDAFNIYQGHGVLNVAAALTAPVDESEVTAADVEEVPTEDPSTAPLDEGDLESVGALDVDYDPLGLEKSIAWASVGGAIVLVAVVLVLRTIIPKGRKRKWRAGTREPERPLVKADSTGT
ncbi:Subtilase family protein [Glycomyces sambucus]|uniref:Subtilase family protein n=1 Tax=Glycomyces sambucus TaxID=380244 RepID=A0A1G9JSL3_9ACTN|nr:S8 family serine peptidase [Glycomyces sambucus]SDL40528.1 Subtilase family protein [Glycomyces sambucus]